MTEEDEQELLRMFEQIISMFQSVRANGYSSEWEMDKLKDMIKSYKLGMQLRGQE